MTTCSSPVTFRLMTGDEDYECMHQLLIDTLRITPIGFNWDARRLEGSRYYNADPTRNPLLERPIGLWENAAGELVAYVLTEEGDDAHLQMHPAYRYLEDELLAWAEENLSGDQSGRRRLQIYVQEYDVLRWKTLISRGYEKMEYGGRFRHQYLGCQPLPAVELAAGYTLRTMRPDDLDDCQRLADLLNAAFERTTHNAAEFQNFVRHAPSYRNDLDLIAVAPDGSFAANVGIPYDEANRWGIFEPVCTHPDHQRKGLGRALMSEGLRRLRAIGATNASVDTRAGDGANALYASMGFTEVYEASWWRRWL